MRLQCVVVGEAGHDGEGGPQLLERVSSAVKMKLAAAGHRLLVGVKREGRRLFCKMLICVKVFMISQLQARSGVGVWKSGSRHPV